jgi:hypothetical protein
MRGDEQSGFGGDVLDKNLTRASTPETAGMVVERRAGSARAEVRSWRSKPQRGYCPPFVLSVHRNPPCRNDL